MVRLLGIVGAVPGESTIKRVLSQLDGDLLDHLQLVADTHHAQIAADERIGYHALYNDTVTSDDGQLPGQTSIDDLPATTADLTDLEQDQS